jgi:hypothetical protein
LLLAFKQVAQENVSVSENIQPMICTNSPHVQSDFQSLNYSLENLTQITAVEVFFKESVPLKAKQLHPNIWTTDHSFYGSSAWGSVPI